MKNEKLKPGFDDVSCAAVLNEVFLERERQHKKWGMQNMVINDFQFFAILSEEFGEVARELAESIETGRLLENYRTELIQLAAVAVQAVERWDAEVK